MFATLTAEQRQGLEAAEGHCLRLIDPLTNESYVLIKAEIYERLRNLLSDDTVYTAAEMLDRVMAEDDVNDPQLAEWQKKYGGVQR